VFLLKLAGMLLGKSKEINRLCGSLQVDSARARQMLDWEPAVTMIQGLQNLRA
jgi:UDP-glucose 4-epimerase